MALVGTFLVVVSLHNDEPLAYLGFALAPALLLLIKFDIVGPAAVLVFVPLQYLFSLVFILAFGWFRQQSKEPRGPETK